MRYNEMRATVSGKLNPRENSGRYYGLIMKVEAATSLDVMTDRVFAVIHSLIIDEL